MRDMENWLTIRDILNTEPFELIFRFPLRAFTGWRADVKKAGRIPEANPTQKITQAKHGNKNILLK